MAEQTDHFKKAIQDHLDSIASADELFAQTLKKENKSIDECINYIYSEVKKAKREGFTDEEIYAKARHYYDEDDLKASKASKPRVVVNHVPELSDQEREELKEQARKEVIQQEKQRMTTKKKSSGTKTEKPKTEQLSLL